MTKMRYQKIPPIFFLFCGAVFIETSDSFAVQSFNETAPQKKNGRYPFKTGGFWMTEPAKNFQ